MDHTIVHFEIPAKNVEKLKKFYEELFAWKFTKYPGGGEMEYWNITTVPIDESGRPKGPGVNGGLYPKEKPEQSPLNYIGVESADEYIAKAKKLGGKVHQEKMEIPNIGWWALISDPEGNVFGILEPMMPMTPQPAKAKTKAKSKKA